MALVVPRKAFVVEPPLIETIGVPEFYLDGSLAFADLDVIHIIGFVERMVGDHIERIEVCRCHMGKTHYAENLARAIVVRTKRGAH